MEVRQKLKLLDKALEELRSGWVFVEGKRDKESLGQLGCKHVLTVSGNLRLSCEKLARQGIGDRKVFVLTDLDRRGDELAKRAREELEGHSLSADLTMRKTLGRVLNIKYFEDAKRRYDKRMEEYEREALGYKTKGKSKTKKRR